MADLTPSDQIQNECGWPMSEEYLGTSVSYTIPGSTAVSVTALIGAVYQDREMSDTGERFVSKRKIVVDASVIADWTVTPADISVTVYDDIWMVESVSINQVTAVITLKIIDMIDRTRRGYRLR